MIFSPTADDAPDVLPWSQPWTVAETLAFEGVGVHSGETVTLRVQPAPAGTGLRFRRMDLPGRPEVPAVASYVADTRMSTTLAAGGVTVQTVEHLLAALWGLGVSDAWLDLDGPEVPIMDGSAATFVAAIETAGVQVLAGTRPMVALAPRGVTEGDRSVMAMPATGCRVSVAVDYGHPHAGAQVFHLVLDPRTFAREIAPARTFGFAHEVEALRAAGLARGGSIHNAIVIGAHGPSSPLRFEDEYARHKALDLVGDLALVGARWSGHVVAFKAGHGLHTALAREIRAAASSILQEVSS